MSGYPSASNTTSNLPQSTVKFYDELKLVVIKLDYIR